MNIDTDMGLPVGGPQIVEGAENVAWDDGDSEAAADLESDAEGNDGVS